MNLFKNFDWSARSIAKIAAVFLVGVLALGIAAAVLMFVFRTVISPFTSSVGGMGGGYYDYATDEVA